MLAYDNCALFVGVGDYGAFDASLGQPAGTSDLPGAGADALAFFRICAGLGIPAGNMRILTSPRLDPEALGVPAECLGDATRASILGGLEWLAGQLGAAHRPPGLFTYSGHGDRLEGEGLALCPSDTVGPNLKGAIPYAQIQAIFEAQRAAANLTVVLDTCHSGAARAGMGRSAGSLSGRALRGLAAEDVPALGDRVIAACKPDQLAWRGRFSGVSRGALSWAVASTLEQWTPRPEGRHVELDLSYGELLDRVHRLLSALDFQQDPVLHGRRGTSKTPFFHAGPGPGREGTSPDPTAVRAGEQLVPDVKVLLTATWASASWPIVSVGTAPPSGVAYNLQTEYWALDASFTAALGSVGAGDRLTIAPQGYGGAGQPAVLTNPRVSLWTQLASGSTPAGNLFVGTDPGTGKSIALAFALSDPGAGSAWTGDITWYAVAETGSSGPPDSIAGSAAQTLTYQALPAPPAGNSWFAMTLPALIWPSAPSQVDPSQTEPTRGAAMATMGTALYLVDAKTNGYIHARKSTDGVSFSPAGNSGGVDTGVTGSSGAPALTALSNTLYLVYNTGDGSGRLHQRTYANGAWSSATDTDVHLCGSPALATVGSILCLAYQTATASGVLHTRASTGGAWTSPSDPGTTTAAGPPSLAAFGGTLFLAFPDTSGRIQIYQASQVASTGITWGRTGNPVATLSPPSGSRWTSAGLSAAGSRLALSILDGSGHVWACFSGDGVSWSGFQDLTSQIPAVDSDVAPAAGALGSTLVIAFDGLTTSGRTLSSIATTSTPVG